MLQIEDRRLWDNSSTYMSQRDTKSCSKELYILIIKAISWTPVLILSLQTVVPTNKIYHLPSHCTKPRELVKSKSLLDTIFMILWQKFMVLAITKSLDSSKTQYECPQES